MISMDKKYRYRHGGEARILAIDAPANQPVISMSMSGPDKGSIYRHRADGRFSSSGVESPRDLIEVKPDAVRYTRVYNDASVSYASKTMFNNDDNACIGIVKITVPDGGEPTFEWISW